mgnify:FL=1
MKYIILMSHGHLASGMKSTVELITGENKRLLAYDAYVDGNGDIHSFFDNFIKEHPEDEIIAVTDVLGGSVNNDALTYNHLPQIHVVTGMNAPMVLNLVLKMDLDTETMIRESISESLELITCCAKDTADEDEDF